MAITPTSATLSAITSAISAAAPGAKRAAAAAALSSDIGSGFRVRITKAGVEKWNGTFTGSLPVSGSSIVLSSAAASSIVTNLSMVRTGGDVMVLIEKASDATHAVSGTGGASGTDFILSEDLDGTKTLSFTITITFSSVPDTVSTALSTTDPRIRWLLDPRMSNSEIVQRFPWTDYQINPATRGDMSLSAVPEPFLDPAAQDYRIQRVSDTTGRFFRFKTGANFTTRNDNTARSAINATESTSYDTQIRFGRTYWVGLGFRFHPDIFASYVSPYEDDEGVLIFDGHMPNGAGGHSGTSQSPFSIFVGGNGYRLKRRWNPNDTSGGSGGPQSTIVHEDTSKDTTNVHYHIWRLKAHYDGAQSPFWTAYKAVGSGALAQLFNISGANVYQPLGDNPDLCYQKVGIYRWDVSAWGANLTRTLDLQGAVLVEDIAGPTTLDAGAVLAMLRAIR